MSVATISNLAVRTATNFTLGAPVTTPAASNILGTPSWSSNGSPLPAGLSLDASTGKIVGTPTALTDTTVT
ncbi:putative Ig domain-containing protein, partial [Streptococcus pneumoniae]|uniref:putative Ig domain-containing protein n=1 Tax=Streptococcus pneumoniae TaxID=1313 RepID=UPI0019540213